MKKITKNPNWIITALTIISTIIILIIAILGNSLTVKSNYLNLHTGPKISFPVAKKAPRGTRLQVIGHQQGWLKVLYNHSQIGWVPSWLVNQEINHIKPISEAVIVIDPGHGGADSGALSNDNQYEDKYTLIFAQKLATVLKKTEAKVILTRDHDQTVALAKRPKIATKNYADAFISFHFDSFKVANEASGITTYYYHNGKSKQLANSVSQQLSVFPIDNRGTMFGNYLVLRDNPVPAILIEGGYINTKADFKLITSSKYQEQMAKQIAQGIANYFAN